MISSTFRLKGIQNKHRKGIQSDSEHKYGALPKQRECEKTQKTQTISGCNSII
jgi:hypothetical protein